MKNIFNFFILILSLTTVNAQYKYQGSTKKSYNATNISGAASKTYKSLEAKKIGYKPFNYNKNIPNEANQKIIQLLPKGIISLSFAPDKAWVLVTEDNGIYNYKAPKKLMDKINAYKRSGHVIKQVSFNPKKRNSYVIVTDKTTYSWGIPKSCYTKIQEFQKKGKKINSVAFGFKTKDTWVIINTDGSFYANNISSGCYRVLKNTYMMKNPQAKLKNVTFKPDGGYLIITNSLTTFNKLERETALQLSKNFDKKYIPKVVSYTPDGRSWTIIANRQTGLSESKLVSLKRSMNVTHRYKIPGISYTSGDGNKDIHKWLLKVTLDYFYCDESDDSDNKDDYIFNQWVQYTDSKNKFIDKVGGKMYVNNSRSIDTRKRTLDYRHIVGDNIIIKADPEHQFWVEEGKRKKIGNYIVFEITEDVLIDRNSRFIIYSSLVEKSDSSSGFLTIGTAPGTGIDMSGSGQTMVDIKKVITDLALLHAKKPGEWRYYGDMEMRKYNKQSEDIYGYINFSDKDRDRKAKAMVRFKLLQ